MQGVIKSGDGGDRQEVVHIIRFRSYSICNGRYCRLKSAIRGMS